MKGSVVLSARTRWFKTGTIGLLAMLLILALTLAACSGADNGDGDGDDSDSTATTFPTATTSGVGGQPTNAPDATAPTDEPTTAPEVTATTPAAEPTATTPAPAPAATATTPAPAATLTPGPEDLLTLRIYLARGEKIASVERQVARTPQVAAAAMEQLLIGPSAAETGIGFSSTLPDGVEYLGTAIEEGVATVNLSGSFEAGGGSLAMRMRLAQVVYTLTQFPTITGVVFALDGTPIDVFGGEGIVLDEPQTRATFEDLTPLILVETPGPFTSVPTTLRLTGTSNTFEASLHVQVVAENGTVLVDEPAQATSGTGTRGTFDITVTVDAAPGDAITLRVFEYSAKDGSEVNIVELPLTIAS